MSKTTLVKDHVLIVGGTGFIGTHIVKEALVRGLQVTIISKNHRALSDRIKDVEYLSTDIRNKDSLYNQLIDKTFHYVINLGGYVDHSNYSSGGEKVYDVHFNGTKNLINCINNFEIKKNMFDSHKIRDSINNFNYNNFTEKFENLLKNYRMIDECN